MSTDDHDALKPFLSDPAFTLIQQDAKIKVVLKGVKDKFDGMQA